MALSRTFKNSTRKAGASPILVLRVQDPNGLTAGVYTQAEWEDYDEISNVSTTEVIDHIVPIAIGADMNLSFVNQNFYWPTGSPIGSMEIWRSPKFTVGADDVFAKFLEDASIFVVTLYYGNTYTGSTITRDVVFEIRTAADGGGSIIMESDTKTVTLDRFRSNFLGFYSPNPIGPVTFLPANGALLESGTDYFLTFRTVGIPQDDLTAWPYLSPGTDGGFAFLNNSSVTEKIVPIFAADGKHYLTTQTLDLGSTPTENAILSVDDSSQFGGSISYEVFADDTSPPTTSRGLFSDGEELPKFRYYKIKILFSTTTGGRGDVDSVAVTVGTDLFLGTEIGFPTKRTSPVLSTKSALALSTKIDLLKGPSIGELSISLLYSSDISNIIRTGYMKNKSVQLFMGTRECSFSEFEIVFGGTWFDYSIDSTHTIATITTRTVLEQLKQVKLPVETFSGETRTTTNLVFSGNILDAMVIVLDAIGVPSRFIDTDTLLSIRDLYFTGSDWNISRTLDKNSPEVGFQLLIELSIISGVFLIQLPSGVLTFAYYDPTSVPVLNIDANMYKEQSISGNEKDLLTRQLIFYGQKSSTQVGNNENDYNYLSMFINATAETLWGEYKENRFFDKWNSSTNARNALIERLDSWFATPRYQEQLLGLPIYYKDDLVPGKVIGVVNSHVPRRPAKHSPPFALPRNMLIIDQKINPWLASVDVTLMQMESGDGPLITILNTGNVINEDSFILDWEIDGEYTNVYYTLDGGDLTEIVLDSVPQTSLPIGSLADGSHTVIIYAINNGDYSSDSWNFSVGDYQPFSNGFSNGFLY